MSYAYAPRMLDWLRANIRRYDILVVHGLWQYTGLAVWLACRQKMPYVVFPHGMLDPWFKRTYPLKHIKKLFYWYLAEYKVLRDAERVVFTCEEEQLLARESFQHYVCKPSIMTLGISSPEGNSSSQKSLFLEAHPNLRSKRLLLFLSRIHEKKGVDILIRAFAKLKLSNSAENLPSLHLVIVGPCENAAYLNSLKELARDEGVGEAITWIGMLSGDLKWGAIHAAEVFVLPSHQENFGIAVVEALACATPVVISKCVNIWREIINAGAGIADADTIEGTLRSLLKWIVMDRTEKAEMSKRARKCFEDSFQATVAAKRCIEILESSIPDAAVLQPR